ncbi:sensor histidine kinase [Curtanaerobium respiraculi]|uniref:sensor histidine kinase n=1 Tax=Curtanaerobium respiraculi TaxID=2949669 RepID=UPI0024B37235|nr:hypothetical protein [Curtanaerobium respiraculi]
MTSIPGKSSIKEGIDKLPSGIAFAQMNGMVILVNDRMDLLCHALFERPMQNAGLFWDGLTQGEFGTRARVVEAGKEPLVRLPDATLWRFRRTPAVHHGVRIWEIRAHDVTRSIRLNERLREENAELEKAGARLRAYSADVAEFTRDRELLDRKIHTHDELGRLLLTTRALIREFGDAGATAEFERRLESVWDRWRLSASIMSEEAEPVTPDDLVDQLKETARSAGVDVMMAGELPVSGRAAELVYAASGEALSNLLRHAHGSELRIAGSRCGGCWSIRMENDGMVPEKPIVEGGGLSSLRERVEKAEGAMRIETSPRFALEIELPE